MASPLAAEVVSEVAGMQVTALHIERAEALIVEEIRRPLWASDTPHSERLAVHRRVPPDPLRGPGARDGVVWPSANPVGILFAPDDAHIVDEFTIAVDAEPGSTVEVSYVGGWTADTVPAGLLTGIARLAAALAEGQLRTRTPAGAVGVAMGGARVQFDRPVRGGVDEIVPGLSYSLRRYRPLGAR